MKCVASTQLRMYSTKGYRESIFLAVTNIPITESNGGHVSQRKCKWANSVTVADAELQQTPDCASSWNWRHAETWLLGCDDTKINNLTGLADSDCWGGGRVRWMNCRQLQDNPKVSDNGRREPRVIFVWFVMGLYASFVWIQSSWRLFSASADSHRRARCWMNAHTLRAVTRPWDIWDTTDTKINAIRQGKVWNNQTASTAPPVAETTLKYSDLEWINITCNK